MRARAVLYVLLGVVAVAAAVLSFSALRDLALLCGFAPSLAWLLPVVVDAGAAAGSLVWLGGAVSPQARGFARTLAVALLGLSVAANALGHALAAFAIAPAWWVVVLVSAVAPAVLGAVVHLAVLVGRPVEVDTAPGAEGARTGPAPERVALVPTPAPASSPVQVGHVTEVGHLNRAGAGSAPDKEGIHQASTPRRFVVSGSVGNRGDETNGPWLDDQPLPGGSSDDRSPAAGVDSGTGLDPVRLDELIADGAGRRRIARELGVPEHQARTLLASRRNGHGPVEASQ